MSGKTNNFGRKSAAKREIGMIKKKKHSRARESHKNTNRPVERTNAHNTSRTQKHTRRRCRTNCRGARSLYRQTVTGAATGYGFDRRRPRLRSWHDGRGIRYDCDCGEGWRRRRTTVYNVYNRLRRSHSHATTRTRTCVRQRRFYFQKCIKKKSRSGIHTRKRLFAIHCDDFLNRITFPRSIRPNSNFQTHAKTSRERFLLYVYIYYVHTEKTIILWFPITPWKLFLCIHSDVSDDFSAFRIMCLRENSNGI